MILGIGIALFIGALNTIVFFGVTLLVREGLYFVAALIGSLWIAVVMIVIGAIRETRKPN